MAHIGNWEWNIETDKAYWSREMYRIFGRDPEESALLYNEYLSYVHPDDRDYVDNAFKKAVNGEPYSIEYRIILANGEERTIHKQSEIIFGEKKNPVRIKGIVQDITERKKAEQALELSEERYRIVTEQTGQLVYDYNVEKDVANLAGNIEELTGFMPDEFRGKSLKFWLSRVHPEDLDMYVEKHKRYKGSGDVYRTEYRFRKKNGEYVYFEDNGVFLKDKKGDVHRILGVIKDITERKKAEIFLANIEIARKKEIHHRIKNNLQVISSLLDLQAEKFRGRECVEDSEVLKAFRESQDRVMSIALIHEELHEGRGTDKLNFSPYLERLVKNLFQTYRLENVNTSLNIELEKNIFFDMDIAVPLGIIINELISNALKYAFPGEDKGEIEIKLFREESAECANNGSGSKREDNGADFVLKVSDNGAGLPEGFNSNKSENLGLQLVAILVEQLGGKLELKRDSGTEFIIKFRV
jgi:PAS domain S-box-containing protein